MGAAMDIRITKGRVADDICITRADGEVHTSFPHKGPVPHDAVHFFVERRLGLARGFWGMVAAGAHPEELAGIAKEAGHASASRALVPDAAIVELIQAERLVECFEADHWSPGTSDEDFTAVAATGCAASFVPLPTLAPGAIAAVRAEIGEFAQAWTSAPPGHEARLRWEL